MQALQCCGCHGVISQPPRCSQPHAERLVFQRLASRKWWQRHACAASKPQLKKQRFRKNGHAAKFTMSAPRTDVAEDQDLTKRVDEASAMLNSMMDDIHQNLFVSGAVADVTGQPSDITEAQAIATAVASRMNDLDEAFLVALGAYCNAAQQQGNVALAGRLNRIQQQVLKEVSSRLPPEMQILDKMLSLLSHDDRLTLIQKAMQGGDPRMEVPGCDIRRIQGAAQQLISDMEEEEAIPDRRLLARLCIAKEEISQMAEEKRFGPGGMSSEIDDGNVAEHTQAVPKAAIAFLKELLTVTDPSARVAYLQKAFREDFDPRLANQQRTSKRASTADQVRPGSFLSCVSATQKQMQSMKGADATLKKLEDIWRESMQVLVSIAE